VKPLLCKEERQRAPQVLQCIAMLMRALAACQWKTHSFVADHTQRQRPWPCEGKIQNPDDPCPAPPCTAPLGLHQIRLLLALRVWLVTVMLAKAVTAMSSKSRNDVSSVVLCSKATVLKSVSCFQGAQLPAEAQTCSALR
jgi:hypothetical protein